MLTKSFCSGQRFWSSNSIGTRFSNKTIGEKKKRKKRENGGIFFLSPAQPITRVGSDLGLRRPREPSAWVCNEKGTTVIGFPLPAHFAWAKQQRTSSSQGSDISLVRAQLSVLVSFLKVLSLWEREREREREREGGGKSARIGRNHRMEAGRSLLSPTPSPPNLPRTQHPRNSLSSTSGIGIKSPYLLRLLASLSEQWNGYVLFHLFLSLGLLIMVPCS